MSGLVRRVIEISVEQDDFLQRRAREVGVTEDELIRRAIEQLDDVAAEQLKDLDAWTRLRAAMEDRVRLDVPQTGRTWTRDELYDIDHQH
jgi:hypothetical protein